MKVYPTDLTDSQWAEVEKIFDNRKRKHKKQFLRITNKLTV